MRDKNVKNILLLFLCIVFVCDVCVYASPSGEELLTRYYRDNGSDMLNGQANILIKTYHPITAKDLILPGYENGTDSEKEDAEKYFKYLKERYDVKFSADKIDRTYQAMQVYYDGESRRKDIAYLDEASFENLKANPKEFQNQDFAERHYYNDSKMTSISEVGESDKMFPQANISLHKLGIPKIGNYGKTVNDENTCNYMLEQLMSDRYVISTVETNDGIWVTAQSSMDKGSLTRIELLFDPDNEYAVKRYAAYMYGALFEERIFNDYIITSSGVRIPTNIIVRKYAPAVGEDGEQYMSFEEETSVFFADYNIDIPESTFVPSFPPGTTVYDESGPEPLEFVTGNVPSIDEMILVSEELSSTSNLAFNFTDTELSMNNIDLEINHDTPSVTNSVVSQNAKISIFKSYNMLFAIITSLIVFTLAIIYYLKRKHIILD